MAQRIYLDHAATTPMLPEAIQAVTAGMRRWANPSSPHAEGRAARAALEDARARIKAALGWDGELIFTSGASEALAIGLRRAKADRQFVSAVEHDAVLRAASDASIIPVQSGLVDEQFLENELSRGGRPIFAIQHVNSETGAIQPIDRFADMIRSAGGVLLADCAQSAGKFRLPDADILVVSAHKFGGPPGVGALLLKNFGLIDPVGGQEFGYRSGTENLPAVLGFVAAIEAIDFDTSGHATWLGREQGIADCVHDLEYDMQIAGGEWVGGKAPLGLAILAITMPHLPAAAQLIQFDVMGFALSAGSACSSGTLKTSRALRGFGLDEDRASRTIRVSFGWNTAAEEIEAFGEAWHKIAAQAKHRAT